MGHGRVARPDGTQYLRELEILRPDGNGKDQAARKQLMNCYRGLAELETDRAARSADLRKALAIAQSLGDEATGDAIRRKLATPPPAFPRGR